MSALPTDEQLHNLRVLSSRCKSSMKPLADHIDAMTEMLREAVDKAPGYVLARYEDSLITEPYNRSLALATPPAVYETLTGALQALQGYHSPTQVYALVPVTP